MGIFQALSFFTGLWSIVTDYFWAAVAIVTCLFVAWWSPRLREPAILVAASVIAATIAYSVGIYKENERWKARANAATEQEIKHGEEARVEGDAAVERSGDSGMSNDRHNRDTWRQ